MPKCKNSKHLDHNRRFGIINFHTYPLAIIYVVQQLTAINTSEIGYDEWYIRTLQEKGRKAAGKRHVPAAQLFDHCLQERALI